MKAAAVLLGISQSVFRRLQKNTQKVPTIFGQVSSNFLKHFYQSSGQIFQKLLYNFRLTFSTRSESSLAPMAPFFAFVYKHRELVKTGSQYVFFHDAPTLVRASSVRSRSRFYFIPSVTPCSAYTGDRQAWDSCSCTVPPFLSALSRTNYFWYSLSQSETD